MLRLLQAASLEGKIEDERFLYDELELIRRQGYAIRKPNARRSSTTVAVPIIHGIILATLCLTTYGRSLTESMIAQYKPILLDAAEQIASAYANRKPNNSE